MGNDRPKESASQLIGKRAERALSAHMPDDWIDVPQSGDGDYGIDYIIQVKDSNSELAASFFLQLKGTTAPEYVNDRKELSYNFKSKTLNYWAQVEPCVAVAVVDLSKSSKQRECPTYYRFLDEEFLESIAQKRDDNDSVTIRIPVAQVIHEELRILPYLLKRLKTKNALLKVKQAVETHSVTPNKDIEAIANAVHKKPVWLDVAREDSDSPWIENSDSHNAGKLKSLYDAIINNKIPYAKELESEINSLPNLSEHEEAEFLSLKASILSLNGDEQGAEELYQQSFNKLPISRYKVNYFESRFRVDSNASNEDLEEMIESLDNSIYRECVLKAKCLALLGREAQAIEILENHPNEKIAISKMLIYTISGNIDAFEKVSNEVPIEELKPRQKYLYHAMLGRRLFYKGVQYDDEGDAALNIIPVKGKSKYDINLLRKSYENIKQALKHARTIGYPNDLTVIVDVSQILFSIFDDEEYLIRFIDEILVDRPDSKKLRMSLVLLKYNAKEYEWVIRTLSELDDLITEQISMLIAANYHSGKKYEALKLTDLHRERILKDKPQNFDYLLCMAAQCAYETLQPVKEAEYLEIVSKLDRGNELLAISNYIKVCNEFPEQRKEQNEILYRKYQELGGSSSIAMQLFHHLDVDCEKEVVWICELAEKIHEVRELFPEENISYAFALSVCSEWKKLEALCRKVEKFSGLDHLWSLLLSSAVDGQGRCGEALEILDSNLDRDKRSVERAENYVHMCVRLGFFGKAESKLEELLGNCDSDKRLSILESLMFIYSADESNPEKLANAIIRFGESVDQSKEEEEGKYLLAFLTMTNRLDANVDDYIKDFQDRLNRYVEKFPDSKILRRGNISDNANSEQVVKELRRLAGISEEKIKKNKKNRNQMRNNKLPIPYLLVSRFLDDVSDIFTVWILAKHFKGKRNEYLLRHSKERLSGGLEALSNEYKNVIFDETSLIIQEEIGVLDKVFGAFNSVVLKKSTYDSFSKASHKIMGSIYSDIPRRIVSILRKNIHKIILISPKDNARNVIDEYQDIIQNVESPVFCCDDLYLTEHIRIDTGDIDSINTFTILDFLENKGIITSTERIEGIENLCSAGITNPSLKYDYIIDSLIHNLENSHKGEILSTNFSHIFDSIFSYGSDIERALSDICKIFSLILNRTECEQNISTLSELINVWLVRYPGINRLRVLSAWFVQCSMITKYVEENAFDIRGKGQAKLWNLYCALTLEQDEAITLDLVMKNISEVILSCNAGTSSDAFDAVKRAFSLASVEEEMFSRVYTSLSVSKRIREANLK